jgi:hypothetical protein
MRVRVYLLYVCFRSNLGFCNFDRSIRDAKSSEFVNFTCSTRDNFKEREKKDRKKSNFRETKKKSNINTAKYFESLIGIGCLNNTAPSMQKLLSNNHEIMMTKTIIIITTYYLFDYIELFVIIIIIY